MRRALAASLVACVAASGCAEAFKPESFVSGLRVLALRAEPAELRPGESTELTALVVDPSAPGRANTLIWLACDPDPFGLGRNACSEEANLVDPTRLFDAGDGGVPEFPPGMSVIGLGERAAYAAPADLFSALPADDRRRVSGSVAQVLMFAIGEELPPVPTRETIDAMLERVRSGQTASIVTLFRVRVSEQSPANENPAIADVAFDGERIPDGAHVALRPGEQVVVDVTAPAEAYETFEQILPEGVETRTERLIAALYATGGEFSEGRVALGSDVQVTYTAPTGDEDDPLPEPGTGRMWIVLRDTRGGVAWRTLPMHVCEPIGAPPSVAAVSPVEVAAGAEPLVTLTGSSLDRLLDVFVGPSALRLTLRDSAGTSIGGTLAPLPPGEHPIRVKARDCTTYETGHVLRAR